MISSIAEVIVFSFLIFYLNYRIDKIEEKIKKGEENDKTSNNS